MNVGSRRDDAEGDMRVETRASVAEVMVRVEQELSETKRADLADAKDRLGANKEKAAELRERAAESLKRAKVRLQDAQDAMSEKTKAVARATDDYVHDHPWGAVGIAAAVGLVVGMLISRR